MDIKNLIDYLNVISKKMYMIGLISWEMDTQVPSKAINDVIELCTEMKMESFKLTTSDEYINLINNALNCKEYKTLSLEEQRYILNLKEEYEKNKRIPEDFYEEYCALVSKSKSVWKEAKLNKDYLLFKDYLGKIIEYTKKLYRYMYPEGNLYDHMLDTYEKGMTSEKIDVLFEELKNGIIPIVKKLPKESKEVLSSNYSNDELLSVARYLLDYIGFDNDRGVLGIFPHGYTNKLSNNDVRITFSNNKNIFDHVCTVIHEGGHGIFEQNIGPNLSKYGTYNVEKYALHESQSRFFENILGRNINFWKPIYNDIKEMLHLDISLEEFVSNLNNAKASLIRTEADELTYCLHIIIRYEIERLIFDDKVTVDELPALWNKLYKDYLDIDVPNDALGLLQDVHWSEGSFGYFPSYLLGSILDGMLLNTVNEKVGNVDTVLSEGNIKNITNYLKDNIYKFGGEYTFTEVAKNVCDSELDVKPLIAYFKDKYDK